MSKRLQQRAKIGLTEPGRASGILVSGHAGAKAEATIWGRGFTGTRQSFKPTPLRTLKRSSSWIRKSKAIG